MEGRRISSVKALEIVDNRGMPTIRVRVRTENGFSGTADVPCGSSTGTYEAHELRDGDERYRGRGVRKAIRNIEELITPRLLGMDVTRQRDIDLMMIELDGTKNKSKLGANATLGVSAAVAHAGAASCGLPLYRYLNAHAYMLPVPQSCMINGGLHAGNDLEFQEYCVMPVGAGTFAEAIRLLSEINLSCKDLLVEKYGKGATNAGEDGGFAPPMKSAREAMDFLYRAVHKAGFENEVVYGIDVAATHFYDKDRRKYLLEGQEKDRDEMIAFLKNLVKEYPAIVSLEDPLFEDDYEGTSIITRELEGTMIIGDDFFTTNIHRVRKGVMEKASNAVLWKPNMIGTVTEAFETAHYAMQHGFSVVVSERSGATEDTTLSDLTVALNAGVIKVGGIRGSERGSEYNRFIEIEDDLGTSAVYAGRNFNKTKP